LSLKGQIINSLGIVGHILFCWVAVCWFIYFYKRLKMQCPFRLMGSPSPGGASAAGACLPFDSSHADACTLGSDGCFPPSLWRLAVTVPVLWKQCICFNGRDPGFVSRPVSPSWRELWSVRTPEASAECELESTEPAKHWGVLAAGAVTASPAEPGPAQGPGSSCIWNILE